MDDLTSFRGRLRKVLEERGWTQAELARKAGVRDATVSDWFNRNTAPKAEVMLRLPQVLGVDGHWLLTGEGEYLRESPVAPDQVAAEDMFEHFEGMVRQMGGAGEIDAAELKFRRLDALEGIRRMFSAMGEVPGWWFRLRDRVEKDEL